MKITYDIEKDVLQISFSDNVCVEETTQIASQFVLDYDGDGNVVGIELREASKQIDNPCSLTYQLSQANCDKPRPKISY